MVQPYTLHVQLTLCSRDADARHVILFTYYFSR